MYCFFLLLIAVYVYSIKFAFLAIYLAFYYFFHLNSVCYVF